MTKDIYPADNKALPLDTVQDVLMKLFSHHEQLRHPSTRRHNMRMGFIVYEIARELGFDEATCKDMGYAAELHDIGKQAVSERILNKPGQLTPEEFAVIKTHTTYGAEMLDLQVAELIPAIKLARQTALLHHERLDGSGYHGVKGDNIPLCARLAAIADVYDASTMARSYHPSRPHEFGVRLIQEEADRGRLDQEVIFAFLKRQSEIKEIKRKYN